MAEVHQRMHGCSWFSFEVPDAFFAAVRTFLRRVDEDAGVVAQPV